MQKVLFDEGAFQITIIKEGVHIRLRSDPVETYSERSEDEIMDDYLKVFTNMFVEAKQKKEIVKIWADLKDAPMFNIKIIKKHIKCLRELESFQETLGCTAVLLYGPISTMLFKLFMKMYGKPLKPLKICKTKAEVVTFLNSIR
tara:strand:- start:150 stop:581 length:432 start_codon:yes stop_codon:yes gene_type:complete